MKTFLLSAVVAAPLLVTSVAQAQTDPTTATDKKPMKHSKKATHDAEHGHGMKMNPDGTSPNPSEKADTKTAKPADSATP